MAERYKLRDGKWRIVGREFPEQKNRTLQLSATLRAIMDNDFHPEKNPQGLSPAEQKEAIMLAPGMTAEEMESIIPLTGTPLADTIRAVISSHRAKNRTYKDKNRPA